jgi:hypothetical protein
MNPTYALNKKPFHVGESVWLFWHAGRLMLADATIHADKFEGAEYVLKAGGHWYSAVNGSPTTRHAIKSRRPAGAPADHGRRTGYSLLSPLGNGRWRLKSIPSCRMRTISMILPGATRYKSK